MNNSGQMNEYMGKMAGVLGTKTKLRSVLAGVGLVGLALTVSGCETMNSGGTTRSANYAGHHTEGAVQRLLRVSSDRAFARLVQPEGFWNSPVARINLPTLFKTPGKRASKAVKTAQFQGNLQHELNIMAESGARVAAPLVREAIARLNVANPTAILGGRRTQATSYLRQSMEADLVNAMIPELERVMAASTDPAFLAAMKALNGVQMRDAAHALALETSNAIWYEIGAEEGAIRENPAASQDPLLTGALRAR